MPKTRPPSQPGEALDLEDRLQQADVALDRAVGRRGENVVDVAGVGVSERGEDVAGDQGGARDEQVAGAEDEVPDQAQHADLLHLAQVHAGDAGQRQGGHQHLQ